METALGSETRERGHLLAHAIHLLPLAFFLLLSLALTWPMPLAFDKQLISSGGDARHNLWILWHTKEALFGSEPLFSTQLLYYPTGISLLTHGLGPITGFFALPFWPWGPEAAHNGAVLIGLALSGYFTYLLARALELNRSISLFAGLALLVAPMHLAGIYGHMTKVFLGMLPLVLLTLVYALDERRSPWWAVAVAFAMLGAVLHSGYQFIYAGMAVALFAVMKLASAESNDRRLFLLRRLVLVGLASAIVAGPLLFATFRATQNPLMRVEVNREALNNHPDLLEFFVPVPHSRLLGKGAKSFLNGQGVRPTVETTVSLSYTGLALVALGLRRRSRRTRHWTLITLVLAVLALGPSLKLAGQSSFTAYELPIILPYAFVSDIPGLNFMRASGRFMMLGYVTFAIAAAFGLHQLTSRYPQYKIPLVLLAMGLLLVERWPEPWPMETLRPMPAFYQQIANDDEMYGVFDLPIVPTARTWYPGYASYYQMYQMTHGKGIHSGYISRTYQTHPDLPCVFPILRATRSDVQVNGKAARCYDNTLYDLSLLNYRYVVYHKGYDNLGKHLPASWNAPTRLRFEDAFFRDQEPLVDDELVTVYEIPDPDTLDLRPTMGLGQNWYSQEPDLRWARSPALLFLSVPEAQSLQLEIDLFAVFKPYRNLFMGDEGRMQLHLDGELVADVEVTTDELVVIPFDAPAGLHELSLTLEAGNFSPANYGERDTRVLSFAIRSINLVTE